MNGLFAWIGFRQIAYRYERDPRFAGDSKFNYWRLWNFSLEGLTSFTIAPLKIATYVGIFTATSAALYGTGIILGTLIWGDPVAGYPSLAGGDAVPRRSAADHTRNHRRISRPRVQRSKTAPTLLRSGILAVVIVFRRYMQPCLEITASILPSTRRGISHFPIITA